MEWIIIANERSVQQSTRRNQAGNQVMAEFEKRLQGLPDTKGCTSPYVPEWIAAVISTK